MLCPLNLMLYISYISVKLVGVGVLILTQYLSAPPSHIPTPPSVGSGTCTVQDMDWVQDRKQTCPASLRFLLSLSKNIPSLQYKGAWVSSLIPNQLLTVDL